jgi:hypothetical protein
MLMFLSFLVAAFLAILVVGGLWESRSQKELRRKREGYSESEFVSYFEKIGIPPEIPTSVYRYFQDDLSLHFPVFPTDRCLEGLRIDEDDFTEAIEVLWNRHKCKGTLSGLLPVTTVEDLVCFLHRYRSETLPKVETFIGQSL